MSDWTNAIRLRLSNLRIAPEREAEIVQELEQHLDDRYADLLAQGMTESAARAAALGEIESVDVLKQELQRLSRPYGEPVVFGANGGSMFNDLGQDVRYAFRMMIKRPWFSLAIILTLGVCIGAVGTIFSAVDAALFRALPYPQPDRLAQVVTRAFGPGPSDEEPGQDGFGWNAIRNMKTVNTAVYAGGIGGVNFTAGDVVAYIQQQRVSAGYFRVMGVPPMIGREFSAEEDLPGQGPPVLILGYNFWRHSFHGDPAIVGKTAQVAGQAYQIIGVAAPGFESKFGPTDVWMPLHPSTTGEGQGLNYEIVGRRRPGVRWSEAEVEVESLGQAMMHNRRGGQGWTISSGLTSLQASMSSDLRVPLLLIMAGTLLVLIIGCVNVASMLLARGVARRGEVAIRMALGAARSTIVRQLMVENLIFGLTAALAGIGISALGVAALHGLPDAGGDIGEGGWAMLKTAQLDWRTIAVTTAVALLATLLVGLFPAIEAGAVDLKSASTGRGVVGSARTVLRRILPAFQVAMAVFLLIGAGLLFRSFEHLWTLTPGMDSANVVAASFSLRDARYRQMSDMTRLFDETTRRLHQIPGVESVAVAATMPFERALNEVFFDASDPDPGHYRLANVVYVTPEFFKTLRIPLVRGRLNSEADSVNAPKVVVVNEALVRRYYRQGDPVGADIKFGNSAAKEGWQIVGIVGDTQQRAGWGQYGPMGAVPTLYIPAAQAEPDMGQVPKWIVRTHGRDATIQHQIETAVKAVDPLIPMTAFRTVDDIKEAAFSWQEFLATSIGIAAILALFLSIVGIYAMMSNAVAERTREFGIRLALGATVGQTIRAAARPGMIAAAIGLVAGLFMARLETTVLRDFLWGVTTTDALTFVAVAAGVLLIAAVASVIPALRISRLDPALTLRQE